VADRALAVDGFWPERGDNFPCGGGFPRARMVDKGASMVAETVERTKAVADAVLALVEAAVGKGGVTKVGDVEFVMVPRVALVLILAVNARRESLADKVFRPPKEDIMPTLHPEQR